MKEKKQSIHISYYYLVRKKHINLKRKKLNLWFTNSKINYLKTMKTSYDSILGLVPLWSSQGEQMVLFGFSYVMIL